MYFEKKGRHVSRSLVKTETIPPVSKIIH